MEDRSLLCGVELNFQVLEKSKSKERQRGDRAHYWCSQWNWKISMTSPIELLISRLLYAWPNAELTLYSGTLMRRDSRMCVCSFSPSPLTTPAEEIKKLGAKVNTYTINLASRKDIYAVAEKVKEEVGKVDILINNAGIVSGKPILSPDFRYVLCAFYGLN